MLKDPLEPKVKVEFWIDASDYRFLRQVGNRHKLSASTLVRWLVRAWILMCRGERDLSRLPAPEPGISVGVKGRPKNLPDQAPKKPVKRKTNARRYRSKQKKKPAPGAPEPLAEDSPWGDIVAPD